MYLLLISRTHQILHKGFTLRPGALFQKPIFLRLCCCEFCHQANFPLICWAFYSYIVIPVKHFGWQLTHLRSGQESQSLGKKSGLFFLCSLLRALLGRETRVRAHTLQETRGCLQWLSRCGCLAVTGTWMEVRTLLPHLWPPESARGAARSLPEHAVLSTSFCCTLMSVSLRVRVGAGHRGQRSVARAGVGVLWPLRLLEAACTSRLLNMFFRICRVLTTNFV